MTTIKSDNSLIFGKAFGRYREIDEDIKKVLVGLLG